MAGGSQLVPALVWALVGEVGLVQLSPGELQLVAELLWAAEEAQELPLVLPLKGQIRSHIIYVINIYLYI